MSQLASAIQQDIAQNREKAAKLYEAVIKTDNAPLEAYINLARLYWDTVDPGAIRTKPFFNLASRRMYEVLDEAEKVFGALPELRFWRFYFNWTILDGSDFLDTALDLVQDGDTIVPYFYI